MTYHSLGLGADVPLPPPAPLSPPCMPPYITGSDTECLWAERDDRVCGIQQYINGHLKKLGMELIPVDATLGPETCGAAAWLMTEHNLKVPDTCTLESCKDFVFPEKARSETHAGLIAVTAIGLVALGWYFATSGRKRWRN